MTDSYHTEHCVGCGCTNCRHERAIAELHQRIAKLDLQLANAKHGLLGFECGEE